jgi:hypothetical protein
MKNNKETFDHQAYRDADEMRDLVFKRTGLKPTDLVCPREQSAMTPCVARDGHLAVCERFGEPELCVGCELTVKSLLAKEQTKLSSLDKPKP